MNDSPVGLILRDLEFLRRRTARLTDAKADERSPGGKGGELRKQMEHVVFVARAAKKLSKATCVRSAFVVDDVGRMAGSPPGSRKTEA